MSGTAITYDISGLPELAARYPAAYQREVVTVLDLVTRRLESAVAEKTPKGVGGAAGLAGSIFGEVKALGSTITGVVGTPFAYAKVIELGRKPGSKMPPIAPIALWAQRKLGLDEEMARGIAFGIARNIARRGFKGHPDGWRMFEKTFNELEPWIGQMMATLPARIAARVKE